MAEALKSPQIKPSYENEGGLKSTSSAKPSYTPEEQEINEQFLDAALNDELDSVKELLKNPKLDVNAHYTKYDEINTALQIAVSNRNKDMIKAILKHPNIDINIADKLGNTALSNAVGSVDFMNILFNFTDNITVTDNDLYAASYCNNLDAFQMLLERHPDKYFIKNHALEIFAEAAKIIDGTIEGNIDGGFLEFIIEKLIEQTSLKEALNVCIGAIHFFGRFETTYQYDFARGIIVPIFKAKISDHEIIKGFDEFINNPKEDSYRSQDIIMIKEYLQRFEYLSDFDATLNGDYTYTEHE